MTLSLNYLVVDSIRFRRGTAMVTAEIDRAFNYRNRAEQARAVAKDTMSRDYRARLLDLAVEFDSCAEDIERAGKPFVLSVLTISRFHRSSTDQPEFRRGIK